MSVEEGRHGEGPVVLETGGFMEAVHKSLAPLVGTHIHDSALRDHRRKCGLDSQEYADWLRILFRWLEEDTGLRAPMRVLDLGCGTGELTVLINKLGHEAWGVDLHQEHLELARILAEENGLDGTRFLLTHGTELPFADHSFDVAHLHVVLEHVPDSVLPTLLGELHRVVRHGIHLIVPNRLQWVDDHTGLKGVPLLPRKLAELYVYSRGDRYGYGISAKGRWDVQYRAFPRIRRLARQAGFQIRFPPEITVFPRLDSDAQKPLHQLHGVSPRILRKAFWYGLGAMIRGWAALRRVPPEGLNPYLNLYLIPESPGVPPKG